MTFAEYKFEDESTLIEAVALKETLSYQELVYATTKYYGETAIKFIKDSFCLGMRGQKLTDEYCIDVYLGSAVKSLKRKRMFYNFIDKVKRIIRFK